MRWRRWAGPAILFLLTVGFFWKLVLTDQYTWLDSPDLTNQVLPWFQFQAGEWHKGRIPLWDPHLWAGQPLLGQAQPGTAYPLNWILFLMPLRNGWMRGIWLNWYFVLIHYMAALFCYWLCRDLGCSRAASIAAGVSFGFGGYIGTTDWPQMLNGAVWAPLVFLFLLRAVRGVRPASSAALSGCCLGLAWLSGHHQIPTFVSLAAVGAWLYVFLRRWPPDWAAARRAIVFGVFAVLTSGLQTLPAYEYGKLAKRWVGAEEPKAWNEPVPYSVHATYSLKPVSLLGIVVPGMHRHADPYTGVTALTLALLAVALAWRHATVRWFAAIAAGGLVFSLGANSIYHGILYALVPMVEKARNPSMAIFIFHFGIAVLTAWGIDQLRTTPDEAPVRRAARILALFGAFLLGVLLVLALAQRLPGDDRAAVTALAALLLAALLFLWRCRGLPPTVFPALVIGLVLLELSNSTGYQWPHREEKNRNQYVKKLAEHADIAAFLRSQPFPFRVRVSDQEIPYNFGDWYGLDQMGGYLASLSNNLLRLPYDHPRAWPLFAVTYTVAREGGPGQEEVYRSPSGLRVFKNANAYPRVWTVHSVRSVANAAEIRAILDDASIDLRQTAFVLGQAPQLETCPGSDQVRLERREPNRVVLRAEMACRGMVVLSETYFPGWVARVDGRPARVYEAYAALRGVVVDRGRHEIVLEYRPRSVRIGALMSVAGVLGAVVLAWRDRRARSPALQ
ncbi:MAG: hypothetical protein RMK57_06050 [Bryobacterales bacterium]|nr:hypothetical protein [Bryobacterales bacterium]